MTKVQVKVDLVKERRVRVHASGFQRFGIEVCGGKEEDVGFGELGEGGIGVVSKIGEIGGDVGRELFGDRGGRSYRRLQTRAKHIQRARSIDVANQGHGEAGIGTTLTRGITHVGGDMYDCVPQGDVIFMKWLLGNVGDDQGSKLPKNCYNALPDDGKVILTEAILPFLSDTRSATKVLELLDLRRNGQLATAIAFPKSAFTATCNLDELMILDRCKIRLAELLRVQRGIFPKKVEPPKYAAKILFCGWRRDIDDMIMILEALLAPGSELWMFNEVLEKERERKQVDGGLDISGLVNIKLVHRVGNAVIKKHLETLLWRLLILVFFFIVIY
ncbi:ion channel DMI1 isoform X1 [Tanacetum coccineum]